MVAVDAGVGGTYDDSGLVTKPPPSMVSLMVRLSKVLVEPTVAGNDQQKVGRETSSQI